MRSSTQTRVWHANWHEVPDVLASAQRQPGERVAVIVPTNDEARLMRRAVAGLPAGSLAGDPMVLTPWEALRRIASKAERGGNAGVSPRRVLLEVEQRLLIRDLRARGVAEADARLLASDIANPDGGGQHSEAREELTVAYDELRRSLSARRGLLPADVLLMAKNALPPFSLVIIVDLERFDEITRRLFEQLFSASNRPPLLQDEKGRAAQTHCSVVRWITPDQEAAGLACWLQWLLRNEGDLRPADVFVAAPDARRAHVMERALFRRRLDADIRFSGGPLKGDPRRGPDADRLHALSRLLLLANPRDVAAWRSWCAWHRSDCGAAFWVALEDWARETGRAMAAVLSGDGSDVNVPEELAPLLASIAEERSFLDAIHLRKGFALIDAVSQSLAGGEVEQMLSDATGIEGAEALSAIALSWAEDRPFHPSSAKIRIGPLSAAASLHPRVLVIMGSNAGRGQEPGAFTSADMASFPQVLVSLASRMDAADAEEAGMEVRRVRASQEGPVALLRPAGWLDEIQDGASPMVAGDEFLAAVGLRLPAVQGPQSQAMCGDSR